MDMPCDSKIPYPKIDFQLSGKFADDSIYLATVQLPVKITDLWIYLMLTYSDMVVTENESCILTKS